MFGGSDFKRPPKSWEEMVKEVRPQHPSQKPFFGGDDPMPDLDTNEEWIKIHLGIGKQE